MKEWKDNFSDELQENEKKTFLDYCSGGNMILAMIIRQRA